MLEHILVIEDDDIMRISLETELQLAGYRVSVAESGRAALELAQHQHFDLVICDILMPGMDGLDTLSALREFQPEARNIVVTGYAGPEAPLRAVKLKVDDYLLKPFTSEQFLQSVRASLEAQLLELRKRRSMQKLRDLMLSALQRQALPQQAAQAEAAARRVMQLARKLGLSAARAQTLQLAARLQGMEPELETVEEFKMLLPLLAQHQEKWDGSGPRGLAGEQIPLDARILRAALATEGGCDPALLELLTCADDSGPSISSDLQRRGALSLLSLAQSYLDSGHLEIANEALQQAALRLADQPDEETLVAVGLTMARLRAREGQSQAALSAVKEARARADRAGLELLRAEANLLEAELGSPDLAGLRRARLTFELFEDQRMQTEADFWLSGCGDAEALARLTQGIAAFPDLLTRFSEVASAIFSDPSMAAGLGQLGDAALPMLEQWLTGSGVNIGRQLRALDLLGGIDTPAARTLLSRVGTQASGAVQLKSTLLVQRAGQSAQTELQCYMLGRFRLASGGRTLDDPALAARKNRNLLAYLAARPGEEVHEDVLIDLFWDQAGPKARHSLHNAISQIRKALKPLLGDSVLAKRPDGYALEPHPLLWIDIEHFQRHTEEARKLAAQNLPAEATEELKKAEQLYRGDFLEGVYDDWAEALRARLLAQLVDLLSALANHYYQRGKHEVSLDYWKRLLVRDNCSEDAYLGIMLCQLALGRQADAVRTYHQCTQKLRQELNLAPPPRIVETYLKMVVA